MHWRITVIDKKENGRHLYGIDVEATGQRIDRAMRENGYDVGSLARFMNVSYQTVYRWTRGKVLPDIQNLYILSMLLGVKMDDLIEGNDAPDISLVLMRRRVFSYYRSHRKIRFFS